MKLAISNTILGKVFNNGQSKICGRQPFKKFEGGWSAQSRLYPFQFFKGCFPQILLVTFSNILSHIIVVKRIFFHQSWRFDISFALLTLPLCLSGYKKYQFFGKFCVRTKWLAPYVIKFEAGFYPLREKCENTEFFLVYIFPYLD